MKLRSLVLFAALALQCSVVGAAGYSKTGTIASIQGDSHTRPGYEDVYWIYLPGPWPGTCGADWAWFNAKENSHLVATVLTARALGLPVSIYVDDSLLKINGVACQILAISFN
jgi:hypothetical protein